MRVVDGVSVYIRFMVTVGPDGLVKAIVTTYSDELWRGMKTQGAFALKDESGKGLVIIVSPNFGVSGRINPGNGSSRTDYIQARIDPDIALKVTDLHFMAHPADDQRNSPWYLEYPNVEKVDAHSNLDLILHDNANLERGELGMPLQEDL